MVAEDFELTEMGLIVMFEKRNSSSFFVSGVSLVLCPDDDHRCTSQLTSVACYLSLSEILFGADPGPAVPRLLH